MKVWAVKEKGCLWMTCFRIRAEAIATVKSKKPSLKKENDLSVFEKQGFKFVKAELREL